MAGNVRSKKERRKKLELKFKWTMTKRNTIVNELVRKIYKLKLKTEKAYRLEKASN